MARFEIISKDGESVRYKGKPKYVGTYLKPSYLEFSEIASPTPINWEIGDYVDYPRTGMRYRLYSIPQASKNAKREAHGRSFTYSNVQFFAATKELEIAPFKDLVLGDNGIHFSTSPDVATFENVHGIADRIQACMDDLYPGRWEIRTAMTVIGSELFEQYYTSKDFALSGGTCLDALSKIYELWQEVGWIHSVDSRTGKEVITIGYANERTSDNTTDPFLYGKGNGLTAIKKTHTNKDEFATRLYVFGSERNLPARYYNKLGIANADSVDIRNLMLPIGTWGTTNGLPDARKAYLENTAAVAKYGVIPRTHYFDSDDAGADIYPSIEGMTIGKVKTSLASLGDTKYTPNPSIYTDNSERVDEIKSAVNPVDDGVMNRDGKSYDEIGYFAINEKWVTTDIAVGDKSKNLNAFILASKQFKTKDGKVTFKSFEGIRGYMVDNSQISKATLVFELTDSITKNKLHTTEHTIELSEVNDGVREFSLPSKMTMSYSSSSEVTIYAQIYIQVEFKEAVKEAFFIDYYINASDCTLEVKENLPKEFHIILKQIGFDIGERASQGEKKAISMKSGMCEGRTFNILNSRYDSETDTWDLECARQQDDTLGVLFPNTDYPLVAGDRFVLLNIAMPEMYIIAAMEELLVEGNKLLARASKYQCNYEPQIDAKLMVEAERSLVEGMYMEIQDEDVVDGGTDYILIDSLNIYEDEAAIPTYKVTLREKRKVSYKGTPSTTSPTSTKSAEEEDVEIDLSNYATKDYVRSFVGQGGAVVLDKAMSDTSENGVQNKVIKAYVDLHPQYEALDEVDAPGDIDDSIIVDDFISLESTNPVQNKVITKYVNDKCGEIVGDNGMFYWEDAAHTIIGTKFPFFSEKSVTAGGKKDDSENQPGLDVERLEQYLDENLYTTETWVKRQEYASDASLQSLKSRVDQIENNGTDLSDYATKDELNEVAKVLDWFGFDDAEGMIKAKFGLYSVDAISAGGKSQGSDVSGGLDEEKLQDYLDENKYVTQTWVKDQDYASSTSVTSLEERVEDLERGGTGGGGSVEGLGDLAYKDSLTYEEIEGKPASLADHNYYDSVYYSSLIESTDYRNVGYSDSTIGKGAAIAFGKMDIPSVIQFVERDGNNNIDIEVRQKKIDADTIVTMTDRVVTEKAAENGDIVFDKLHIGDAVLSWDATAKMLKFNKGIYSIGAVSAGEKGTTYTYQFDNWSDWVWAKDADGNKLAIPTNTKLLDYALSARLGVLLNERVTKIEDNAPIGNLTLDFAQIARNVGSGVSNNTMANLGLTEQAIENILDGRYNKVVGSGANRDVWNYSAYENTSEICIFLRQGNAVFDFKYNKSESTWTIADEA